MIHNDYLPSYNSNNYKAKVMTLESGKPLMESFGEISECLLKP